MAPALNAAPKKPSSSSTKTSKDVIDDDELRPYVLVTEVGKGSFATVYKGYHEETRVQVAIKTVRRDGLTAKLFDNLQSEIEILKSLSHRHITKLINIIRAQRNIYLIMEFCAGGDLTNYIKKRGRVEGLQYQPSPGTALQYYPHPPSGGLDEIVVRSFLRQLARALKFLRHRNLVHRDIKPQNLLLTPASASELGKGHPLGVPILKVADFGFARSLPNQMMAETLCGSPLYMAPEILRYEKYDAKADLWSVGAVLYEMAVGRAPFRASNHIELLKKIEHSKGVKFPDEDPQPGTTPTPVPADVKQLIRALLKRNPAERSSFEDFFSSTALANSKFPRPAPVERTVTSSSQQQPGVSRMDSTTSEVPDHHKVVPPEVLDPQAMIPPSRINFRRRESDDVPAITKVGPTPSHSPIHEKSPPLQRIDSEVNRPSMNRPLSTEESVIPGETEEDGMLRREYVLVGDTKVVDFDRAVDEINARRKPLKDRKDPSSPLSTDPPTFNRSGSGSPSTAPTFPPPPNPNAPQLSASPTSAASRAATNALTRALNLAKKNLFGTSRPLHYRNYSTSSSPRRAQIIQNRTDDDADRNPLEDELLGALEDLAQKTDTLTNWADEMYEYVKAIPQKPLPDPTKFAKREGEAGKDAARRRHADDQAQSNAVTCVAIYMLLMTFSQKGIDKLRNYQEHMAMRHPDTDFVVSEGFDDALAWFKERFIKCNDRAALVKTWLPAQYEGPRTYLDQLVYDRALALSRTAARKELFGQTDASDECEKLYEESLWCLYALQDDLLQSGNPFAEEDRNTIATWIKRTKLRLVRCRARMAMTEGERVADARADVNLVDAARVPAPWEAQPDNKASPK